MSTGERVTWETCPACGRSAAVGWRDGSLVQIDCPSGCRLTAADFPRGGHSGPAFPHPVVQRATW